MSPKVDKMISRGLALFVFGPWLQRTLKGLQDARFASFLALAPQVGHPWIKIAQTAPDNFDAHKGLAYLFRLFAVR